MLSGDISFDKLLTIFTADYIAHLTRYLGVAGVVFLVFYLLRVRRLRAMKIQTSYPPRSEMQREFFYSLCSLAIFSLVGVLVYVMHRMGWTNFYLRFDRHGYGYLIFSTIFLIVAHDTYFYWTHRLMHWKPLFKLCHRTHHMSRTPTPWAAFAFHPLEAVIEAGMFPILVLIMPFHPLSVVIWLLYMTVMNVMGHSGFEILPRGFTNHPLCFWHNTSVHHDMHHRYASCNYGLYFNIWDRLMGTNHPRYSEEFEQVKAREAALMSGDDRDPHAATEPAPTAR